MLGGMGRFALRPRFTEVFDLEAERLRSLLGDEFARLAPECELKSFPGFICLRVPPAERHFWSPRLNLSLDRAEGGGTLVTAIYGPNANMWSAFFYGYLFIGSGALFAGILGCCQAMLGIPAWGLWVLGGLVLLVLLIHGAGLSGRRIGAGQMRMLRDVHQRAAAAVAGLSGSTRP